MTYEEIKNDLESKLKVIGWELRNVGCKHYRIHDHKGLTTIFLLYGEELRSENFKSPFGGEHSGTICLNLNRCDIEIIDSDKNDPFISIIGKEDDHKSPAMFISFYKI